MTEKKLHQGFLISEDRLMEIAAMSDGTWVLPAGLHYIIEPGKIITIQAGNLLIRLFYDTVSWETEITVTDNTGTLFEHTDIEQREPDDEPDYTPPQPVVTFDEEGRRWTTHQDGTVTVTVC